MSETMQHEEIPSPSANEVDKNIYGLLQGFISEGSVGGSPDRAAGPARDDQIFVAWWAIPCAGRVFLPAGHPIREDTSSGIYHQPGDQFYEETNPEECFATPQEAEDAGYRAAKV